MHTNKAEHKSARKGSKWKQKKVASTQISFFLLHTGNLVLKCVSTRWNKAQSACWFLLVMRSHHKQMLHLAPWYCSLHSFCRRFYTRGLPFFIQACIGSNMGVSVFLKDPTWGTMNHPPLPTDLQPPYSFHLKLSNKREAPKPYKNICCELQTSLLLITKAHVNTITKHNHLICPRKPELSTNWWNCSATLLLWWLTLAHWDLNKPLGCW